MTGGKSDVKNHLLARRLNQQFLNFIHTITLLHQFQRKKTEQNELIVQKEDIAIAIELFTEAIYLKVDDLSPTLRKFYEVLKASVQPHQNYCFYSRDVRLHFKIGKAQFFRNLNELIQLEYVVKLKGNISKGFLYQLIYVDDMKKLRTHLKSVLKKQVSQL